MQTENEKNTLAAVETEKKPPRPQLGELRNLLASIEKRIAKLKEISAEEALEILLLFDQADSRSTALENAGVKIGSEATQLETLLMQFRKRGSLFIRQVGGSSALRQARQTHQPDADHWWWYMDEALASQRKSTALRWLGRILLLFVVLAGFVFVYQRFLAPDPAFTASYGLYQDAENALMAGDPQLALEFVNEALTYTPDDPELYLMQGILYLSLDEPDAAEESFGISQQKFENDELYYVHRAKLYMLIGEADLAIENANITIALNPDMAYAYIYRGQAYEALGDSDAAIADYEQASKIAERTGNSEIQVIARIRITAILQMKIPSPDVENP